MEFSGKSSRAGRLSTRLIELAEANEALDGTKTFRMVLSQDELAHALGTSRESIGRAFAELRANGVIEQQRSEVRVLDAQALFDMSRVTEAPETAPALTPLI